MGDYPGGTWDELPCEWGGGDWETREGQKNRPLPPHLGHMGAHPMSPPEEGGAYFCPSLVSQSPPPTHMGAHPMSPLGNLPLSSPQLIPCPPLGDLPLSTPSHMGAHPMSPLGYLPLSTPHSHGSSSHAPPLDRGHGSSSHVPLKKEEGDEGCSRVPPLSYQLLLRLVFYR